MNRTNPLSASPVPRAAVAAALTLALVAGCVVGPNYRPPQRPMPGGWQSLTTRPTGPAATRVSVVTPDAAGTVRFWEQFNDPVLARLIAAAAAQNLDLAQARSRLRQARASRAIAAGGFYPNVDASGSYRRSGGGDVNGDEPGGGSRDAYRAGFDASWEVDVFGGVRRNIEASDAEVQAAVADLRDVRVSLIADVAVNYFSLRAAQQRLDFAVKNLAIQRQSLGVTERKFAGGRGFTGRLDLANAEAQVASTESSIPSLESSARQSIFDLALLLGREPGSLVELLSPGAPIPAAPPVVPAGLPSDLLRRRPDVRRAEAQIHSATARVGVAVADLFPRFSLSGSFGTNAARPKGLANWANTGWSIGPSVSWNVFDAGRLRAAVLLAEARRDESVLRYEQTVLTALRDAERAMTAYDYEQRRRVALQRAREANARALTIARSLYDQGLTEFLNVLNAQAGLLNSEDAIAASDAQIAANLVTLYRVLGGGWEDADVPPNDVPTPPVPFLPQTQPAVRADPDPASRPAGE